MIEERRDLIIIGGGAGGLSVASAAAQLGLNVTLIEKQDKLGGDCLHYGCVPSKTLIHSAKVAHLMRHADKVGLEAMVPPTNLAKVNQHVKSVIDKIQVHDNPERFRDYGCEVLFTSAKFINTHQVEVDGRILSAKRFVLAMGSHPAVPPIAGLDTVAYQTNESIFSMQNLPKHLVVLGAGAIGIELAQAFVRLGSQVTVIEMAPHIIPAADHEASQALLIQLEAEGIDFHLASKVTAVQQDEHGMKVVECESKYGETLTIIGDELLVATGRSPNVNDVNLDVTGVAYSPRGIEVDARLRTRAKHIFAMGDVVASPYKFTHVAEYHAGIVIANVVFRVPKKTDYRVLPTVVFSDPELASVGLTEQQAAQQGLQFEVLRFYFNDVDRAITEVETQGFVKLLVAKGYILGATLLGPHAGELLAEIVLAMQAKIKIGVISAAIHAYPTLAQINRRVVNTYYGAKLFSPRTRKIVAWIKRVLP